MTIDEAIKVLHQAERGTFDGSLLTLTNAFKLGIEALKRVKKQRGPGGEIGALGLPGETPEESTKPHET